MIERPKVIYNEKTGKFVMWMHIESPDYEKAHAGVAVCDSPTGAFTYLGLLNRMGQIAVIRLSSRMMMERLIISARQNGTVPYISVC